MSVSVLQRPIGVKLGDCVAATIDEDYTGYATVNKTSHGLTDGQYVFVQSNIENYNGFWPIYVIDGHHFFLLQYPSGPRVSFIVNAEITYCEQDFTHGWSCVHLPIVYRLSNNLWPVNSSDTARTVSSFTDANGYVNLNLSGALKGTVNDLDYVKISGAANEDLNGVWQITDAVSTSDVTIDLVYDVGYSFAGATVQFYYNNYHLKVRVYGGLSSDHQWYDQKPYVLLHELKMIPDESGQVKFSVHDILKTQIFTKNNLLQATLPCNIDFFTQFYISYAEAYDTSDGTEVTSTTESYTSDELSEVWTPETIDGLSSWTEAGSGAEWTDTATPVVQLVNDQSSEYKGTNFAFVEGDTYRITYSFTYTDISGGGIPARRIYIRIMDASSTTIYYTKSISIPLGSGTITGSFEFIASPGSARINIRAEQEMFTGSRTYDAQINSITLESLVDSGFEGYAANSKLPFKNQHSGFLTDYINGSWLTLFDSPVVFDGQYFDLSAIVNESGQIDVLIDDVISQSISGASPGIYRIPITPTGADTRVKLQVGGSDITEEITLTAYTECANQSFYLSWLNYLGGFDYWDFQAQKEYDIDILEVRGTKNNIFPDWQNSYGQFADTIEKDIYRNAKEVIVVRSQYMTLEQLNAVKYIRTSPLVQMVTSRQNRKTVLVDQDSFKVYDEGDKLYSISFTISLTDNIPSQTV